MELPPSLLGADHEMLASLSNPVALTANGASGTPTGTTEVESSDLSPTPAALEA